MATEMRAYSCYLSNMPQRRTIETYPSIYLTEAEKMTEIQRLQAELDAQENTEE